MERSEGVYVAGSVRTPFGRYGGRLRDRSPIELGTETLRRALERAPGADVGELVVGMGCFEGGEFVPARQMLIGSGLPDHTPSLTVDRACCSGMTAIGLAARGLATGGHSAAAVVGVDVLSGTPYLLPQARWGNRRGDFEVRDPLAFRAPFLGDVEIARYTGEEALRRGCDRAAQDEWALISHQRYGEALAKGLLDRQVLGWDEIGAPGEPGDRRDEQYRPDARLERMAALPTVYGSATVTAGNSPGLNDGAASVVLATRPPEGDPAPARVVDHLQTAGAPTAAVYLPGQAILEILRRNGVGLGDVHAIEINEAFAATVLCSLGEVSAGSGVPVDRLTGITNAWGGAVAIGHPLGASGVRIVTTLIDRLAARGGGYGVAAICGGFGQTDAMLLRVG